MPGKEKDQPPTNEQYTPKYNGGPVDLGVLKTEIIHGFRHVDTRLDILDERLKEIEACQRTNRGDIDRLIVDLEVLKATALRIDAIRLSAVVAATVTILLGLATLIAKIAGLW